MRKYVAFAVLIFLLLNCAYVPRHYTSYWKTKQIVIIEQLGEVVDPEEREKFDLFRGIQNFKAATYYRISGGGYEVEILTEDKKLVAVNRDPQAIEVLHDYIERYEDIRDTRDEHEENWGIIDYDNLGQPITMHECEYIIKAHRSWLSPACIGAIIGCGSAMFVGGVVVSFSDVAFNVGPSVALASGALGILTGFLTGGIIGIVKRSKFDISKAVEEIKQAREPRVVE